MDNNFKVGDKVKLKSQIIEDWHKFDGRPSRLAFFERHVDTIFTITKINKFDEFYSVPKVKHGYPEDPYVDVLCAYQKV